MDAEWLQADYRDYRRSLERAQIAGLVDDDVEVLSFSAWLDSQPDDYLAYHGAI